MGKLLILLLYPIFMGCGKNEIALQSAKTPSFIHKDGMLIANRMEGTPVIWNNQLMFVVSNRMGAQLQVEFYNGATRTLIGSIDVGMALIATFVDNGTMFVFGSNANTIQMISSSDLLTWTQPVEVIHAVPGRDLFNVSVSKDSTGYIMAYETCEADTKCFNARFAHSTDLLNWSEVGKIFMKDIYAACPTIRYIDGYYYVFYLRFFEHFSTVVNRSKDLIIWEDDHIVLSPTDTLNEGENNSDMDLVEFNGQVIMEYAQGNQQDKYGFWTDIMIAKYNGTLSQFVKELFH